MPPLKPGRPGRATALIVVRAISAARRCGVVQLNRLELPCALGRGGIAVLKREGDGATPRGQFLLRHVFYRADVKRRPKTRLDVRVVRRNDGWCDDPADRNYNRLVSLPYASSAEYLWRSDDLYDLLVVLDHNCKPRLRNRGSAIFIHVAREGFTPTEGCIALRKRDLNRLLAAVPRRCRIAIQV